MVKIHVETRIAMPDDIAEFIGECFEKGGSRRLQLADIFEWLPDEHPTSWDRYLEDLEERFADTTIWFYSSDYL